MPPDIHQLACATCANSFQEAGGDAAGWAIMFLLAVVVAVLGGVAWSMARIVKRGHEALDPRYHDE